MRDRRLIKIRDLVKRSHRMCKKHNTVCLLTWRGEILAELFPGEEPLKKIASRISGRSEIPTGEIRANYFMGTPLLKIGNKVWRPDGYRFVCDDARVAPRVLLLSLLTDRSQFDTDLQYFGKNIVAICKNFRRLKFLDGLSEDETHELIELLTSSVMKLVWTGHLSYTVQRTIWVRWQFKEYLESIGKNIDDMELKIKVNKRSLL